MTSAEKKDRIRSLQNVVDNHVRLGKQSASACLAAMDELNRLQNGGLEFRKTLGLLARAAKAGVFVTYGDVAAASGLTWDRQVMSSVNRHLDVFSDWCHRSGLPMLSAVVVREENRGTGLLDGTALRGFLACAERIGAVPAGRFSPEEFLVQQRSAISALANAGRLDGLASGGVV